MQDGIDTQRKALQEARAAREHERDITRDEPNAQAAQARADWAASYAAAASEMARLAAVNAEAARGEADALTQP